MNGTNSGKLREITFWAVPRRFPPGSHDGLHHRVRLRRPPLQGVQVFVRRRAAAESAAVVVPPRGRGRRGGGGEQERRKDKPGHVSLRFHFPPSFPAKTHQKKWKALFLSLFLPSEVLWRLTLSAFGDLEKEEERERERGEEREGDQREREREKRRRLHGPSPLSLFQSCILFLSRLPREIHHHVKKFSQTLSPRESFQFDFWAFESFCTRA